ncbi:MAG TPA: hypothetical protein VKM54_26515 [Myxococcota bacterium]|nr:hypothetical protein [Myxococcota bacterium]
MFPPPCQGSVIRLTLRPKERKARAELSNRQEGLQQAKGTQGMAKGVYWGVPHTRTISKLAGSSS